MRTKEEIEEQLQKIRNALREEKNPLQFVYGVSQKEILKWVLEDKK